MTKLRGHKRQQNYKKGDSKVYCQKTIKKAKLRRKQKVQNISSSAAKKQINTIKQKVF